MYKKFIVTSVIMLMLCITVSFAWMLDIGVMIGDPVIKFDESLYIGSDDLEAHFYLENEGNFEEILNTDEALTFDNMYPGDAIKYKLVLKNLSNTDITTTISFSDIKADDSEFFEHVYIGVLSHSGFYGRYTGPEIKEFSLATPFKEVDENYVYQVGEKENMLFIENLEIPADTEVEIRFYIRIDFRAETEIAGKSFSIDKLKIMCI